MAESSRATIEHRNQQQRHLYNNFNTQYNTQPDPYHSNRSHQGPSQAIPGGLITSPGPSSSQSPTNQYNNHQPHSYSNGNSTYQHPTPSAPPISPNSPLTSLGSGRTGPVVPLPLGASIMATADLDEFSRVNIGGITSVEGVKDAVLTRLHISDDDHFRYDFHLAQLETGRQHRLSDDALWDSCWNAVQTHKTLTISVKEVAGLESARGIDHDELEMGSSAAFAISRGRHQHQPPQSQHQYHNLPTQPNYHHDLYASHRGQSQPQQQQSTGHDRQHSAGSRSDVSASAPGDYGEFGEPRAAYSPQLGSTHAHSWGHSQRPAGAQSGLTAPVGGGPRAGSTTPTPDERNRWPPSHHQPPPSAIPTRNWNSTNQILPSPSQPVQAQAYLPRIQTQPIPQVRTTVPPPQNAPHPQQRPGAPSAYHHSTAVPQNQFYNLSLQTSQNYPTGPQHSRAPPSNTSHMSPPSAQSNIRRVAGSKSVDDLRANHLNRPFAAGAPPVPTAPSDAYRTQPQRAPITHTTSSFYPAGAAHAQSRPAYATHQPATPYAAFDPRVMAQRPSPAPGAPGSVYAAYAQPQLAASTTRAPTSYSPYDNRPQPPSQVTYTTAPPQQSWSGQPQRSQPSYQSHPQPASRVFTQAGPSTHPIPLHPGQTLQSVGRNSSDSFDSGSPPNPSVRGPSAELMRSNDPTHVTMLDRRRPTDPPAGGVRRSREARKSGEYQRPVSSSTSSVSPTGHSASASGSSSSSAYRQQTATSSSRTRDSSAYGGLADVSAVKAAASPSGSARSSMSAATPVTPANDSQPLPQLRTDDGYADDFDDDVEDEGTFFRPPGMLSPLARAQEAAYASASSPMSRQRSAPADQRPSAFDGWGNATVLGPDVKAALEMFNEQDGEGTLMGRQDSTLLRPRPMIRRVSSQSEPGKPKEDDFGYGDEFEDDSEAGTWMAGGGKPLAQLAALAPVQTDVARLASPTSPPVGVSLKDEPSSRSPVTNRIRQERPNLRLRIEGPNSPDGKSSGGVPTARQPMASPGQGKRIVSGESDGSNSVPRRRDRLTTTNRPIEIDGLGPASATSATSIQSIHSPSPVVRRSSFAQRERQNDWAPRPPVEDLLQNMDDYFPNELLDQPVFDAPTPVTSTAPPSVGPELIEEQEEEEEFDQDVPLAPPRVADQSGSGGLGYKKSIRFLAVGGGGGGGGRGSTRSRHPPRVVVPGLASNLLRRASTKLFGRKIEEVTSAKMSQLDKSEGQLRDVPDPANFSYQWIKGDEIGRGTFGRVYIGFEVKTRQAIAVKQVEMPRTRYDKEDARGKAMIAALKSEIELLKDLDHPNIVLYIGMEQTPEHLSIFLEYVPGGSVGRIVRTHGQFEENVIKFFTFQILEGLQYLHDKKILHRDLKADNILTDQDGMCKISDFGTSKRSASAYTNDVEMSMQGTIFWMAPEVVHNEKTGYSAKADIWSVGCICLEMFAGCRPWSDSEAVAAMIKLGAQRIAPPIPEGVHPSVEGKAFLDKCLAIEPVDRPRAVELKAESFLELPSGWSFADTRLYGEIRKYEQQRETRQRRRINATA